MAARVHPYLQFEHRRDGKTVVTAQLIFDDHEAAERFHDQIIEAVKHELDTARGGNGE